MKLYELGYTTATAVDAPHAGARIEINGDNGR